MSKITQFLYLYFKTIKINVFLRNKREKHIEGSMNNIITRDIRIATAALPDGLENAKTLQ